MPIRMDQWDAIKSEIQSQRNWWLIGTSKDSSAVRFQGTFFEAIAEAGSHSLYWKSATTVHPDFSDEGVAPKDRVGPSVARVKAEGETILEMFGPKS